MRFDDGIAIVSLESACVMHFSQAEPIGTALDTLHLKKGDGEPTKIPVYLNPGSLVVMSGDARYLWKHEINRKPGAQQWDGRDLEQHRRTSVTLRKLLASPNWSGHDTGRQWTIDFFPFLQFKAIVTVTESSLFNLNGWHYYNFRSYNSGDITILFWEISSKIVM